MSDPTDPGGVGANAERSRSTRVGDSGSPVGSPLTIVLALVAVIVGFLIFRSIDDSDAGGIDTPDGSTTVAAGRHRRRWPEASTATTAAPATDGRGCSGHRGSDGHRRQRQRRRWRGAEHAGRPRRARLQRHRRGDERHQRGAARRERRALRRRRSGDSGRRRLGRPRPRRPHRAADALTGTRSKEALGTATVLVMMGNDIAGEPVEDLAESAAPNVEAPAPAGGATTTT